MSVDHQCFYCGECFDPCLMHANNDGHTICATCIALEWIEHNLTKASKAVNDEKLRSWKMTLTSDIRNSPSKLLEKEKNDFPRKVFTCTIQDIKAYLATHPPAPPRNLMSIEDIEQTLRDARWGGPDDSYAELEEALRDAIEHICRLTPTLCR